MYFFLQVIEEQKTGYFVFLDVTFLNLVYDLSRVPKKFFLRTRVLRQQEGESARFGCGPTPKKRNRHKEDCGAYRDSTRTIAQILELFGSQHGRNLA